MQPWPTQAQPGLSLEWDFVYHVTAFCIVCYILMWSLTKLTRYFFVLMQIYNCIGNAIPRKEWE